MTAEHLPVVVVIPGDLHLTMASQPNYLCAVHCINEINDLVRPDLVQFIGDNVQDGTIEQFALFRDLTGRLDRPWHALVGDHDAHGDPCATAFRAQIGDPCGAFGIHGFRIIRLNTQEGKPAGLSTAQLDWFRGELQSAENAGERVILFQHNYPFQIWEDFAGPGIDTWRREVHGRGVQAILCGHTHYWQVANDGRNVFVATRSIGDPEGGPPGYTVAYFHQDDFAVTFRTPDDRGPLAIITHPRDLILATGPAHVVRGDDEIRVRVWSAEPLDRVVATIENEPAIFLTRVGPLDWAGPLRAGGLDKGGRRLEVQATDRARAVGTHAIEFAVDSTGRYTAVPRVNPVVASTNFC